MDYQKVLVIILTVAVVMYGMRMLPLVFCKGKIKNKFLRSFLSYVPYTILAAMTVSEIFTATSNVISATLGGIVAVLLAYLGQGLLVVALSATATVFVVEQIMSFIKF